MVRELKHPVLIHKLNKIRDISTPRDDLISLLKDITSFMIYEVLSDLELREKEIEIWMGKRSFEFINEKEIVFIPILRAGLPMLEGAIRVVPSTSVGFLAIKRDEETLESRIYYSRLPEIPGKRVVILDPMLATGGTLVKALEEVKKHNPKEVLSIHIVCAPEGVNNVLRKFPEHKLFTISVDEYLNDKGYIIPGLGDMGDRLYS